MKRFYYRELLEAGVSIHEYRPAFRTPTRHDRRQHRMIDRATSTSARSCSMPEVSVLIYDAQVVERLKTIEQRYFDASDR